MKILVTGGTGFIGRYVVNALCYHEVTLLTRKPTSIAPYIICPLDDKEKLNIALSQFNPDAVIHLAWEGIPDFSEAMCLKNRKLSQNLFEVAAKCNVRTVIVAGSCAEYQGLEGSVSENQWGTHLGALGKIKKQVFKDASTYLQDQQRLVWLRLFYVFGKGQRQGSLIPSLINDASHNQKTIINNPEAAHDFIHVSDVADMIRYCIENEAMQGIINVGNGKLIPVAQIAQWLYEYWNKKQLSHKNQAPSGMFSNTDKLNSLCQWKPKIDVLIALQQWIDNVR